MKLFSTILGTLLISSISLSSIDLALQNKERPSCLQRSSFQKWEARTTKELLTNAPVIETDQGPVQYLFQGEGPIVLSIHGGFGGWDQGFLISSNLVNDGFQVLTVSRPGYLSTPIFSPVDAAQQAELMISLLDALNIPKVAVLGFSAGAPVAYELAKNHPERISSVVLECIGASPGEDFAFYAVLGAVLATETEAVDFVGYLAFLSLTTDFFSLAKEILSGDTDLEGLPLKERICFVTNSKRQSQFLKGLLDATIPIAPRLSGTLNDFLGINYWTTAFSPDGYALPTVMVQARNDNNGYYPTAVSVHEQLPTSELITVEDSGHFIWLGPQTKQWERQVTAFLRQHVAN